MSLFGNWPPPCFCCCCCCWNSLSLKSWLWLHFFGQRILWKPPSPQKQMNTPQAHTGKKVHRWQQLQLLFMGGPSPWLSLLSGCPQTQWSISSPPGPRHSSQGLLHTDWFLWKLFFYQFFLKFMIALMKKGWPYFPIWKRNFFHEAKN